MALFPYFALQADNTPASSRRAGCLLPPTCLALGTVAFAEFEDSTEVTLVLLLVLDLLAFGWPVTLVTARC